MVYVGKGNASNENPPPPPLSHCLLPFHRQITYFELHIGLHVYVILLQMHLAFNMSKI